MRTKKSLRRFTLVLLFPALGLFADVRAQVEWQTMTGMDKSFTVELQGVPSHTATELKSRAGAPYTMHQYVVRRANLTYFVQTANYPAEVDVETPRGNLQAGIYNAAKDMKGGRWASIDWLTHQGRLAVNAIGERDDNAIRTFLVLKGHRIVWLTYAGPIGSAQSPDVNRFIGSLNLDPSP